MILLDQKVFLPQQEKEMNNIDTRSPFFPNSKTAQDQIQKLKHAQALQRNTEARSQELQQTTKNDAKVNISDKIKDFSRIKRAVDMSAPVDNTDKIAQLKAQIKAGTYEPDYDAIADKMLSTEF